MTLKGDIIMRNSFNALIRTLILLACSVIQVIEIIFRGFSEILGKISELLKTTSDRLMRGLDRGTYEATDDNTVIEES